VAGFTDKALAGNTQTGNKDGFVTKYNNNGVKQYTRQWGVAVADISELSVATDSSGNVYVAGTINAPVGIKDFFVTKYNSSGVKQYFTRQLGFDGSGAWLAGLWVTADAGGNVYLAGNVHYINAGTGGVDGNMRIGSDDVFVTKYDANGVKQYTRQLGVAGGVFAGSSVAIDASGNVYVAGSTSGALDGNTLTGLSDFFITKYDANGVKQFTRQLGVAGAFTNGYSVGINASGNVYVVGITTGGLDGNTRTGTTGNFFVTTYDSNGVKQYTRQFASSVTLPGNSSVFINVSGFYVVGSTTVGLDGNTLTGIQDFFVTKYDSYYGARQYTRQLGVAGEYTVGNAVATDASGNVYVAGTTTGGLDGNTLTGIADFFVTKYNSSGVKQ
jgi:hypothetical protein